MSAVKNELSPLGRKIFLDRYALKDVKKETLNVGEIGRASCRERV